MWNNKEVKYMTLAYLVVFAAVLWFSKSPVTAIISCGLCYGASLFFVSRIFKKINKVNKVANQVITHKNDPDFELSFSSYEEGDIGILMDNFSEMVRILKESIETQQNEKIFLKSERITKSIALYVALLICILLLESTVSLHSSHKNVLLL